MNITADTDVLIWAAVQDDPKESALATRLLREADRIAITLSSPCEFVRVLVRGYRRSTVDVAAALRRLIEGDKIAVDRPAVEAGLAVLEAGGDFADGVVAFEGRRLGGKVFATFDRRAAGLLGAGGREGRSAARRVDLVYSRQAASWTQRYSARPIKYAATAA